MSVYTAIAKWANNMEEARRKRKALQDPLTSAGFLNYLHAFEGSVGQMFKHAGSLIVQHISTCSNDLAQVFTNTMRQGMEQMQQWVEHTYKLYDTSMQAFFDAHNGAAEVRHQESQSFINRCRNDIMAMLKGLASHQQSMDANQHGRYVALEEEMRLLRYSVNRQNDINIGVVSALFANLTEQIQRKQRIVVQYKTVPTLEWIIEHAEELIYFGKAASALRENTAPQDIAQFEMLRSLRSLLPCENSIQEVREAIELKAHQWGVAA